MQNVYIVAANRTAIGKMGGALKSVQPQDLAVVVLKDILKRGNISADQVDEVILGWTRQTTDAANIARYSALLAGYPETIRAYTVMQQCSSSMLAVHNAMDKIMLGRADVIVAGGVESLSNAPYYLRNARYGFNVGNGALVDSVTEGQINSQPISMYGSFGMGMTAENIAEKYGISREEQDAFAFQSQTRYQDAYAAGKFKDEIVPVVIPQRKGDPIVFDTDEHPRLTPVSKLATLKPAFKPDGSVTAGNCCGRNDGASVLLIMSERKVQELGLKPMAKLIGQGCAGVDPRYMGLGPVPATEIALKDANLTIEDIDLAEINEAFAAQVLGCLRELKIPQEKLNVNGGAIAVGHPLGATGARILTTLLFEMQRRDDVKYGLATLCVGGGLGSATIVEKL